MVRDKQAALLRVNMLTVSLGMTDVILIRKTVSSVEDRGQTDRWTLPLSLASAAPRRTSHRTSSQPMTSRWKPTTTSVNQFLQDATVDTRVAHTYLR